jgi:predicted nuclease of predicted toxin-antitoxin system
MQAAQDHIILDRALRVDRVVVSVDFAALLALRNAARPSFILFREPELVTAVGYAGRLLEAMASLEPELNNGCDVVFRRGRLRVRNLPFSD